MKLKLSEAHTKEKEEKEIEINDSYLNFSLKNLSGFGSWFATQNSVNKLQLNKKELRIGYYRVKRFQGLFHLRKNDWKSVLRFKYPKFSCFILLVH